MVEFAQGKPLSEILGISYKKDGKIVHNPDRPQVEDLDAMPWATKIYKRDMDVTRYNVPFLLHPYIALYSTRGCPAQCTFCLWPQTLSGHAWRKRSTDDVAAELKWAKENFPEVKEFFFDDDTFNIQKVRTIELCEKLKPLGLTWSCTSRVTTDRDTLKAMKDAGCRLLDRWLRVGRSADPQEHQEGRHRRTRARLREGLQRPRPHDSRRLHPRPARRDQGVDPQHDQLRQDAGRAKPSRSRSRTHIPAPSSTTTPRPTGSLPTEKMEDGGGHQMAHIEYPGLPTDYVMEMVHRFYDEYYFRPKAAFRVIWKAIVNRDVPRLYVEAKAFLKLRAQRNKMVKNARSQQAEPRGTWVQARSLVRMILIEGGVSRSGRPPFFSFATKRALGSI